MANDKFRVEPIRQYKQARYPSAWARQPAVEEEEKKKLNPAMLLVVFVLTLGLALGLIGCLADYKAKSCGPGLVLDSNGNCVGPDPNDCNPGVLVCDQNTLMVCNQDGQSWSSQECDVYCSEMYGFGSYSKGCDALADDPCQCDYDIIDGDIAECTPGGVACWDDETVAFCNQDSYSWTEQNCNDYCLEVNGPDYHSNGCNAQADDPCQCEYDIIEGIWVECTPGEFTCVDEDTASVCSADYMGWENVDCIEYCTDNFGDDYYSTGCKEDNSQDNICGCEYGMVDGEPAP